MSNNELLERAAQAQQDYFQAAHALEEALGIELDGEDLSQFADAAELKAYIQSQEED